MDYKLYKIAICLEKTGNEQKSLEIYSKIPENRKEAYIWNQEIHLLIKKKDNVAVKKAILAAHIKHGSDPGILAKVAYLFEQEGKLASAYHYYKLSDDNQKKLHGNSLSSTLSKMEKLRGNPAFNDKEPIEQLIEYHEGVISEYNDQRGFGFIKENGIEGKIFFHIKNCRFKNPVSETEVKFCKIKTDKGWSAENVTITKNQKNHRANSL